MFVGVGFECIADFESLTSVQESLNFLAYDALSVDVEGWAIGTGKLLGQRFLDYVEHSESFLHAFKQ